MDPFSLLAKQLDKLERERTEVPHRKPHYGGLWLAVPILFALGGLLIKWHRGRRYFETAGAGVLWLGFVLVATVFVFVSSCYQNRVPIKIQLVVDLAAWLFLAWMFFYFKFWEA